MTDYVKASLNFKLSTNSDYESPEEDFQVDAAEQPGEKLIFKGEVSTTALTLDLGQFTSITSMVIRNRSSTAAETVLVTWFHAQGSQGADDFDLAANDTPETITDNSANGTMVTNGAVDGGWVRLASAEDSGNDGVYLIGDAAADVLTLGAGTALTTDNSQDTTVTLAFEHKNYHAVAAGGYLRIDDNIVPAGDLVLTADSGTPHVEVYVLGS